MAPRVIFHVTLAVNIIMLGMIMEEFVMREIACNIFFEIYGTIGVRQDRNPPTAHQTVHGVPPA